MQEVMIEAENHENDPPNDKEDGLRTAIIGRIKEISTKALRTQIGLKSTSAKDSKGPTKTTSASHLFPEESDGCMPVPSLLDSETGSGCEEVNGSSREASKKRKRTGTPTKPDNLPLPSPLSTTLTARKKKGRGGNKTCEFCGKSFTRFTAAQRHMKYNCEKGDRLPPPDAGLLLSCAYCSYESANNRRDHMNNHIIRCHPEMFFQSERDNSSESSPWKQEHFKSILKNIAFPKFILRNSSSPSSSCLCSVCGKKYSWRKRFADNSSELTIHLINNHVQEIRKHLKYVMGQSDTWMQEKLSNALSVPNTTDQDQNGKRRSSKEGYLKDVDESESSDANDEDNDIDND